MEEEKTKQKRTRSRALTLRLTAEELKRWQKQYVKSQEKNQTDFLMRLLGEKDIVVIEEYTETLVELKRQGNNLNQIARHLNEGGQLTNEQRKALNGAWTLYQQIEEIGNAIIRGRKQ